MPTHVLIIRLSALGDIAMTVPVILSACREYSQVHFTLLTSRAGERILRAVMADTQNLSVRGVNVQKDFGGIGGLNCLYAQLRREGYDAVIDLHDVLCTQWLRLRFRLNGVRSTTIDKGRAEKKALVRHTLDRQLKSSVERYRDTFVRAGLPFAVSYDPQQTAACLPPPVSVFQGRGIGIAPFAQHPGKVYPKALMLQVIRLLLSAAPDIHIYIFGGPDEQAELDTWATLSETRIHNVAGRQTIADDMALMAGLESVVSMDSANMHLASLVGTRVVSIWGATHPKAGFLGFRQQESDIVSLPLPCRPCSVYGNKPCQYADYRCLTGIQPETIVSKILCP